jgi:hypothetical protein
VLRGFLTESAGGFHLHTLHMRCDFVFKVQVLDLDFFLDMMNNV